MHGCRIEIKSAHEHSQREEQKDILEHLIKVAGEKLERISSVSVDIRSGKHVRRKNEINETRDKKDKDLFDILPAGCDYYQQKKHQKEINNNYFAISTLVIIT